jgi:hypothetical protein
MNNNITTRTISEIANFDVPTTAPRNLKEHIVANYIDNSKYEFIGFVDRSNTALLRERFYNVRDTMGRFSRVRSARR